MSTLSIPDAVFLVLGILTLLTLLSIRSELKRISGKRKRRRHHHGISFEEQNKLRTKYLHSINLNQPA